VAEAWGGVGGVGNWGRGACDPEDGVQPSAGSLCPWGRQGCGEQRVDFKARVVRKAHGGDSASPLGLDGDILQVTGPRQMPDVTLKITKYVIFVLNQIASSLDS
jgi:hypothetical protein